MLFSIVIPVYNVEQYLSRCLDSCVHQDLSLNDYEIIVVNDGSPDGSQAIAENYVSDYPNVILLNQENRGLSVARNNGLKKAKGKYVWFVDSDDWIAENCLLGIVEQMETQELDMLQIGYTEAYEDGTLKPSKRGFFEGCMTGCQVIKERYIPAPAQFTIYNRSFLEKYCLEFYPGIYHEDAEFKPRALYYAKRFASLNRHVYYYYQRPTGSIMSHYNVKRGTDVITICKSLRSFEDNVAMNPEIRREFDYIITVYLNEFFRGIQLLSKDERRLLVGLFQKERGLITSIKNSKSRAHNFAGWLLTINIPLGIQIITKLR